MMVAGSFVRIVPDEQIRYRTHNLLLSTCMSIGPLRQFALPINLIAACLKLYIAIRTSNIAVIPQPTKHTHTHITVKLCVRAPRHCSMFILPPSAAHVDNFHGAMASSFVEIAESCRQRAESQRGSLHISSI